jgi:hypothetical protein
MSDQTVYNKTTVELFKENSSENVRPSQPVLDLKYDLFLFYRLLNYPRQWHLLSIWFYFLPLFPIHDFSEKY